MLNSPAEQYDGNERDEHHRDHQQRHGADRHDNDHDDDASGYDKYDPATRRYWNAASTATGDHDDPATISRRTFAQSTRPAAIGPASSHLD
jgi:hypothetical protein